MIDLERVGAWLGRPVRVEGRASTGSSNTTLFIDVDGERAVLQHPPAGPTLPTAHDLARQHRYLRAVAGTAVPVPRVLAFCDDAAVAGVPFLICDRRPGVCLLGEPGAEIDARALSERAVDVLVAIHAVDWRARGLSAPPGSYIDRQVRRWRDQLARTPTAGRLGDLDPIAQWLLDHRPAGEEATIVHGDFGFHNLLVAGDGITAVLDWELATIGDPLVDVFGLAKSWGEGALSPNPANDAVAHAPGALSRDELFARYEHASGRAVNRHRLYYEAFSLWRSVGIFEGVHARSAGTRFVDEVPELVRQLRVLIAREV